MTEIGSIALSALPFALLGAVLGLDVVSFPQIMVSRPIISATVAGALAGNAAAGLTAGVVLELIALETLPFGASRYVEWGSAGVVGGAVYAAQPEGVAYALPLGVFSALATAMLSGRSMVVLRKLNVRAARHMRPLIDAGSSQAIAALQLRGMVLDLLRGGLVTWVSLVVCLLAVHQIAPLWKVDAVTSRAVVVTIAGALAASRVWCMLSQAPRARWFLAAGLAVGCALVAYL